MESDHDYFARRAREEQASALAAADPESRDLHLKLAEAYAAVARAYREEHGEISYPAAPDKQPGHIGASGEFVRRQGS
jgi:hypothetical protein